MEYGNKLNPTRSLRTAHGIKGNGPKVIVTHSPSKIDQNQLLLVRFQQGIIFIGDFTKNCMKLRIKASDKSTSNSRDKAIAEAHGNKFIIPLDFEMLDSAGTRMDRCVLFCPMFVQALILSQPNFKVK